MFGSKTYKYKHDKVEAIQFLGYNWASVQDFVAGQALMHPSWMKDYDSIEVETPSRNCTVFRDDYVVKEDNTFNVYGSTEFKEKFEENTKERYDDLAQQYQDECEAGEYDYLNTEHLSEFLQKHF